MHKKGIIRFSTMAALTLLLSFHMSSYAIVAYVPQALRDCINVVHEMAQRSNRAYNNFKELQDALNKTKEKY